MFMGLHLKGACFCKQKKDKKNPTYLKYNACACYRMTLYTVRTHAARPRHNLRQGAPRGLEISCTASVRHSDGITSPAILEKQVD